MQTPPPGVDIKLLFQGELDSYGLVAKISQLLLDQHHIVFPISYIINGICCCRGDGYDHYIDKPLGSNYDKHD